METNPPLLELYLPLAPSINNLYTTVRGRRVLTEQGRLYKSNVGFMLNTGFTHELIPPKTDLCFEAIFFIPKSAYYKRDLDNCLKCTIDAVFQYFKESGSPVNDNRITKIICTKRRAEEGDNNGYSQILISTISGETK